MERKGLALSLIVVLIIVIAMSSASALTGSIGNARMIIHAKTGEQVEKYVLVKNVNDVSVDIQIEKEGNLSKYIRLKETNFIIPAGGEKKAEFTIGIADEGTSEGRLNIKFSSVGEKNGVGLSSTIIVVAEKGTALEWEEETNQTSLIGDVINDSIKNPDGNYNMIMIAALITIALAIVLLGLIFISKKRAGKEKGFNESGQEIKPKKESAKKWEEF